MLRARDSNYLAVVGRFARSGADIINIDPRTHYERLGRNAKRPLEPGFIPCAAPPKVVAVSYYPNETEVATPEFERSRAAFAAWGRTGDRAAYEAAYIAWLALLPSVAFHRDWIRPVFAPNGIADHEFAWLPLVKCPLPPKSVILPDDIFRDRMLLWDQLTLLQPRVMLVQGLLTANVVRPMCDGKFPHEIVVQKIGRVGSSAYHAAEQQRVRSQLAGALERAGVSRGAESRPMPGA